MDTAAAVPTCAVCRQPIRPGESVSYRAETRTLSHIRCTGWGHRVAGPGPVKPVESVHSMFGPMA